ncbi:MAG: hypothetical protein P8Z76_03230 [Alphaproteobacteria bacterium]|jgi:hypothetical protein
MSLVLGTSWPTYRLMLRRLGSARRARKAGRRRWGVREIVCGTMGELMGLRMGAGVRFQLINGDLMPEAAHQLAWSLSLTLGALAGGLMGRWIARLTRQEPARVPVK